MTSSKVEQEVDYSIRRVRDVLYKLCDDGELYRDDELESSLSTNNENIYFKSEEQVQQLLSKHL